MIRHPTDHAVQQGKMEFVVHADSRDGRYEEYIWFTLGFSNDVSSAQGL